MGFCRCKTNAAEGTKARTIYFIKTKRRHHRRRRYRADCLGTILLNLLVVMKRCLAAVAHDSAKDRAHDEGTQRDWA